MGMVELSRRALIKMSAASLGATTLLHAAPAAPQSDPQRPIRIIVPYAAGGASDTLARLIGAPLERGLGRSLVVDNRGGGASVVGTQAIATAPPDGYTIGVIDSAFTINPGLFGAKLPYDTKRDFAPVSLLATAPLVLAVHPSVKADSPQALVALAKAQPGKLTFASAGLGTAIHLAGEQLRQVAGIDIVHIPYRGGGPSVVDLIGGQVQFTFSTIPSILEHVRSGRVRALGVTGERAALLPDVPSMKEAGLPGVDASPLFGMVAPAKTPEDVVKKLSTLAANAVKAEPLRQRLIDIGFVPVGSTPDEFRTRIADEIAKWTRVVEVGNIKPN